VTGDGRTRVVLVDPTAEPRPARAAMAARPGSLEGLSAGLLANGKANSMALLEALAAELTAAHGLGRGRGWSKPTAYRVAAPAQLDELAVASEVALVAIGD
jgi:hypothetical protein